jgi:CRISPR-associated endonuclease/helicase Cas3
VRFARLLAKSSRQPERPRGTETLAGHTAAVVRIGALIGYDYGERILESLGLASSEFLPRLRLALPRAAAAHDLGKGNDHFQRMIRHDKGLVGQAGWHEYVSAWLLLGVGDYAGWLLEGLDESLRHGVTAAVLGHHLRAEDGAVIGLKMPSGSLSLRVLCDHDDFRAAMDEVSHLLALGGPPPMEPINFDLVEPEGVFDVPMHQWLIEAGRWWRGADDEDRRFVAALKALLIAADVAGSAIPRFATDPVTWAERVLRNVCTTDELERIVTQRLGEGRPRPFQLAVRESTARVTFVRAGCGSGKTAAAYLWAARRAAGRKLFVCYPTTGTASQGFGDYVPPDEFEATLAHSRAEADLDEFLVTGEERGKERIEELIRLKSLAVWGAPITVCTVDTVLGLIQNNRMGLFGFPAIGNGAFVFDEIHQYDDDLFDVLLRFLTTFRGVPVLLMTASLPRERLASVGAALAGAGEELAIVDGPAGWEALPRYRIERASEDAVWGRVEAMVRAGQRVLWVANTVDRAVMLGMRVGAAGLLVEPYHSRYRYQDRLARHRAVVEVFEEAAPGGVVAVTTQVCEVSLDLSADLLVTDLAPVPALIQRLGRLKRRATPEAAGSPAPALVLEPPDPKPYEAVELDVASGWLDRLGTGALSQTDLARAFEDVTVDANAIAASRKSEWLDGGALSGRAPLREEGTTIPVIRGEDAAGLGARPESAEVIRLTIPMPLAPVRRDVWGWPRRGAAFVAPAGRIVYDERWGGRWR